MKIGSLVRIGSWFSTRGDVHAFSVNQNFDVIPWHWIPVKNVNRDEVFLVLGFRRYTIHCDFSVLLCSSDGKKCIIQTSLLELV